MIKLIVYTAIFGDYDVLNDPLVVNKKIEYICFTDNKEIKSKVWDIRIVERELTPRREARKYKILSHEYIEAKESLWIDGCILIYTDPIRYLSRFKDDMLLTKHWRNCVYDEAKVVVRNNKETKEIAEAQMDKYRDELYPKDNGLVDTTCVFRRMNPQIEMLEEDWWDELNQCSKRDQLSFNYVAWRNQMKFGLFSWRKFGKRRPHIG